MRAEDIVHVGTVVEGRVRSPGIELSSGSTSSLTSLGSQSMRASKFGTTLRSHAYEGKSFTEQESASRNMRLNKTAMLSTFTRTARSLSRGGPRARAAAAAASVARGPGDEASTSDSATLNSEETDEAEAELNCVLREASDVSSIHSRDSGGTGFGSIRARGSSPASADEASVYSKGGERSMGGVEQRAALPARALKRRLRRKSVGDITARRATLSKEKKAKSRFLAIVTQAMHADHQVTPRCMLSHTDSRRLMAWDVLMCILVVYVAIFAPFEIAFTPSVTTLGATTEGESSFLQIPPLAWFIMNTCVSAVWTLDIILQFRISRERRDGRASYDACQIAIHYLSGWFVIDVIATVPWDLLLFVGGGSHGGALITRAPKVARILRIPRIVKVSRFYRLWRTWHPTALARIKFSWLRTVGSVFVVLIVVHWMACGFYLLHEVQGDSENSWVTKLDDIQSDSAWRLEQLYVATLYWSVMTLTTIGYGDIAPENTGERIYTICTMFVGAILFSFILSEIAALLDTMRWRTSAFQARIDSVGAYLERKNLPPWLRRKCIDFLFEAHAKNSMGTLAGWGLPADSGVAARPPSGIALGDGGGVEGALLWLFSPYLRHMIGYQLFAPFFHRTPEFASLSPDFLGQLAMQLVPVAYGAREYIYVIGDAATSMYFLATGRVQREAWSETETVTEVSLLCAPECFGHDGAISMQAAGVRAVERSRRQSVRTLTFSDVYVLPRASLAKLCASYDAVQDCVRKYAVKRAWRWIFRLLVRAHMDFYGELVQLATKWDGNVDDHADRLGDNVGDVMLLLSSKAVERRRRTSMHVLHSSAPGEHRFTGSGEPHETSGRDPLTPLRTSLHRSLSRNMRAMSVTIGGPTAVPPLVPPEGSSSAAPLGPSAPDVAVPSS